MEGIGNLFFLLWKKKNAFESSPLKHFEDFRIPETVVYEHNYPKGWFTFVGNEETLKRRVGKEIDSTKLLQALSVPHPSRDGNSCPLLASYVARSVDERNVEALSNDWLDAPALTSFLLRGGSDGTSSSQNSSRAQPAPKNGLLQRFVPPQGTHNDCIQVYWTPFLCQIDRRASIHPLSSRSARSQRASTTLAPIADDGGPSLYERAVTFEGPTSYSRPVSCAEAVMERIKALCQRISLHIYEHDGRQVQRLVLHVKLDAKDRLWTLYAPQLILANPPAPTTIPTVPPGAKITLRPIKGVRGKKLRIPTNPLAALNAAPFGADPPIFLPPASHTARAVTHHASRVDAVEEALATAQPDIGPIPSLPLATRKAPPQAPTLRTLPASAGGGSDVHSNAGGEGGSVRARKGRPTPEQLRAQLLGRQHALLAFILDPSSASKRSLSDPMFHPPPSAPTTAAATAAAVPSPGTFNSSGTYAISGRPHPLAQAPPPPSLKIASGVPGTATTDGAAAAREGGAGRSGGDRPGSGAAGAAGGDLEKSVGSLGHSGDGSARARGGEGTGGGGAGGGGGGAEGGGASAAGGTAESGGLGEVTKIPFLRPVPLEAAPSAHELKMALEAPPSALVQALPRALKAFKARQVLALKASEWLDGLLYRLYSHFLTTRDHYGMLQSRSVDGPPGVSAETILERPFLFKAPPEVAQSLTTYLDSLFRGQPGVHVCGDALLPPLAQAYESTGVDGDDDEIEQIIVRHAAPRFYLISHRPDLASLQRDVALFKRDVLVGLMMDVEKLVKAHTDAGAEDDAPDAAAGAHAGLLSALEGLE